MSSLLEPQELMVDTAGYSDVVFGLFWLLGFQFSPRLRDLSDVRFWRIGSTAEIGRVVKTIYLLGYMADSDERRRILTQLNRGESRHALTRSIFFGHRGEMRKAYRPGQEDQLGALGLVVNAVIHWNTVYTADALTAISSAGRPVDPDDVLRISPLIHGHIQLLGRYRFELPARLSNGSRRKIRVPPG